VKYQNFQIATFFILLCLKIADDKLCYPTVRLGFELQSITIITWDYATLCIFKEFLWAQFLKKLTVFKELMCTFCKTKDTRTLAEAKARVTVRKLVLV